MTKKNFETAEIWSAGSFKAKVFLWVKIKIDARKGGRWIFSGFMALLSALYRFLKPKGMVLTSAQGIKLYLDGKDDVMTPEILAYGYHEETETLLFKKHLRSGMTVLDIGANIGYFSLLASQLVGPQGKVYSFEPAPDNYKILIKNIEINSALNITAVPKALSNHQGIVDLFCDGVNFGAHTLASENIEILAGSSMKVETLPLDSFVKEAGIAQVDFIKMDVQGAEGLVLEKASETLESGGLKILMEFWPAGLRNLKTDPLELLHLLARNFEVAVVENQKEIFNISPDEILKIAENRHYINLFCMRKNKA